MYLLQSINESNNKVGYQRYISLINLYRK